MTEPHDLSYSECEALLRSGVVGRVALSTPNGPQILPVNYSVVDSEIIVRTSAYSVLGTYGREATLAFEVDHFDLANQRGWSVVARGRADVITDPAALDHIRKVWEPRPWAGGSRGLFLRIPWTELTGRQVGEGWQPLADLPYRRVV
ncbi:MAG: pyridoxamine 5-phosphate oxidase-related, FMN-binding protein [Nocardioides sp.]|jgi:nitroimidazol reductase NimA-like FMN-containing flavoprotein (pyridoxamine 5'-phosphate oxidase superfamily)|uniref:pyridoxamine 5'-phosphate oxidase family protein n=1 Tax=Nocardioides sp. TaxID=35761 RepID=UPI00260E9AA8|nr:pyridoxamine 5'-phosphate oxidase family protein [Nocardioides sp.]MCW2832050.1 pyridoxamine 5-phosphate oxidase-related, FMN-binding protein [Nocardioides sp.]